MPVCPPGGYGVRAAHASLRAKRAVAAAPAAAASCPASTWLCRSKVISVRLGHATTEITFTLTPLASAMLAAVCRRGLVRHSRLRRASRRLYVASPPMPPLTTVLRTYMFIIDRRSCGERDRRPRARTSGRLDARGDAYEGGGAS